MAARSQPEVDYPELMFYLSIEHTLDGLILWNTSSRMKTSTKLFLFAFAALIATVLASMALIALGIMVPRNSQWWNALQWLIWIEAAAVFAAVAWGAVHNLYAIICTLLDTVSEPVLWLTSKAAKRKK